MRYNCIDHSNGLNIYEQEIMRVIDYESEIPRITKRNDSEISRTLEDTDAAGYRKAETTVSPPDEHEQREIILIWNHTGDKATQGGAMNDDRVAELCIEANLVDPSVAWELNNVYLLRFQSELATLFQQDRVHPQPHTTDYLPAPCLR